MARTTTHARAGYPTTCPDCKIDLTRPNAVRSVEHLTATYQGAVQPDGTITYDRYARINWTATELHQASCEACGYELVAGCHLNASRALEQIEHLVARGYDHLRDGSDQLLDTVKAIAHATRPLEVDD